MRFDRQAEAFDRRAGLTDEACGKIARALIRLGDAAPGDLLVEVGAGTGQIGSRLPEAVRYLGFDSSAAMLSIFRKRLASGRNALLLRAGGNRTWPLANSCARIILGSRVFHLLDAGHLVTESFRIGCPDGASLLIGHVRRDPSSLKARIRREMLRLLEVRGRVGRSRREAHRRIFEAARTRGGSRIEPVTVARWTVSSSPGQSIRSWRDKEGLGGLEVPGELQEEILRELESWAKTTFGRLERTLESEETYVLEGVRFRQ